MEQIKKHIFWVVMGALLLIAVIASFVITGPVRSENKNRIQSLEKRIAQLDKYAKDCKNKTWIKQAEEHEALIQKEEKAEEKFLTEVDYSELFNSDPALWKDEYRAQLIRLVQSLQTARVVLDSRAFHTRLPIWGDRVPTREEMEIAQREFYVLEDLSNIILSLKDEQERDRVYRLVQIAFPGIPEFQEAEFDSESSLSKTDENIKRKKIRDTYLPIPVVLILDMDSKYLGKLLAAVLSSPWRYNVHNCDIVRKQEPKESRDRGAFELEGGAKERAEVPQPPEKLFENTTVRVRLYLEALDFTPLKAALLKKPEAGATE